MTIRLSRRQIGDADRVGGIELMILWPDGLGPTPVLEINHEREAEPHEWAYAESLVQHACVAALLVPVHVRVTRLRRPPNLLHGGEERTHLAVTIIGHRWVHAKTKIRGRIAFAQTQS